MAVIHKLSINQFRNLNNQFIQPSKNINLFVGGNAEGKTNLIEAIYYLGHNRSFKTKTIKELIRLGFEGFQLNTVVDNNKIQLEKSSNKTHIKINQRCLKNTSELTQILPIQIIAPEKGLVVNGVPKNKRSYLDWGVFHVKPTFLKQVKNYHKILKNTNSLLTHNKTQGLDFWFLELAKSSTKINQARTDYIQQLKNTHSNKVLPLLSKLFQPEKSFNYQLKSGWQKGLDNLNTEQIYQHLIKNKRFLLNTKYLNYGPHKASIDFSLNGKKECFLSRGEQKTLSIVFWLTQVLLLIETGIKPIVLIDDLSSELDLIKTQTILDYLSTLNIQVFVTDIYHNPPATNHNIKFFSINNGVITPQ